MAPVGPLLEMLIVVYHKALFYAHYFSPPIYANAMSQAV